MSRLLWIGDAGRPTGFSRVTHEIGERLVSEYGHEINVLAIGYDAADPFETRLHLHRSESGPTRNYLGFDRVVPLLEKIQPDAVVTLEDPAILLRRLFGNPADRKKKLLTQAPILSYLPIDGVGLPADFQRLPSVANVVAMSRFGQDQLPGSEMAYHGIDSNLFHPIDAEHPVATSAGLMASREECREAFSIPKDAFVVGRVDTNSGRKDWGNTWRTFEAFVATEKNRQPVAIFHTKKRNPGHGIDLPALASRGKGTLYITDADSWPIGDVVALVNTFDVFLTTSRGEGFGLTIGEALACGVPVVATDFSAIPEVVGPGGYLVPGKTFIANPYGVDQMIGDHLGLAEAISWLAADETKRQDLGSAGRRHVIESFSWDDTARQFDGWIRAMTTTALAAQTA